MFFAIKWQNLPSKDDFSGENIVFSRKQCFWLKNHNFFIKKNMWNFESELFFCFFFLKNTFSFKKLPFEWKFDYFAVKIHDFNWKITVYRCQSIYSEYLFRRWSYWYNDNPLQMILFCSIERKIKTEKCILAVSKYFWLFLTVLFIINL